MDANLPLTAASQSNIQWLSLIVLLPALGALVMPFLENSESEENKFVAPRNLALGILLSDFVLMVVVLSRLYNPQDGGLQFVGVPRKHVLCITRG